MKQIIIEPKVQSSKLKAQKNKTTKKNLGANCKVGEFVMVKITKTIAFKLYGKIIAM